MHRVLPTRSKSGSFLACLWLLRRCLSLRVPHYYGPLGHQAQAHDIWGKVIQPSDVIIDATCGNGHDSLFLASKLSYLNENPGKLYCIDIQEEAITATTKRLTDNNLGAWIGNHIQLIHGSHSHFPSTISPETVGLICYNLGYLPGKTRTVHDETGELNVVITKPDSTLMSLKKALPLIRQGGLLSVVAYPGHPGGQEELHTVQTFMTELCDQTWRVYGSYPLNKPKLPVLFNAFKIDKRKK